MSITINNREVEFIYSSTHGWINKIRNNNNVVIWESSQTPISDDLCIIPLNADENNYIYIDTSIRGSSYTINYRYTNGGSGTSTDTPYIDISNNPFVYLTSNWYPLGAIINCKKRLGSIENPITDPNVPFKVKGNLHSLGGSNSGILSENYAYAGLFAYTGIVDASDLNMSFNRLSQYCYQNMFRECASLINAPVLPANTLAQYCYDSMFVSCTSLTTAPALPATELAQYCYSSMFSDCISMTTPPTLSATTLEQHCCEGMFQGCTSLTTSPILYALELAPYCYQYMFSGCTNLNSVTTYAQNISAYQCLNYWLFNVSPTGTFYNNGGVSYTYPSASGIPSGWTEV